MTDTPKNRFTDKIWVIALKIFGVILASSVIGWASWTTLQGMKVNEHEIKISHNVKAIEVNTKKIEEIEKVQTDVTIIRNWVDNQK